MTHPFDGTIATTDGRRIWVFRYASAGRARSLFVTRGTPTLRRMYPELGLVGALGDDACLVVSEPLGVLPGAWQELPEASCAMVSGPDFEIRPLVPPRSPRPQRPAYLAGSDAAMSAGTWTPSDEGFLRAYQWAGALAAGAALPQEQSPVRLGPGEVAHARLAPVGMSGFFGEDTGYRRSFLMVGGPVGLALTGAASIARNQAKKAEAQRAAQPRWHDLGQAELVVTAQRLVLLARGKVESFWYAETRRRSGRRRSAGSRRCSSSRRGCRCSGWSRRGRRSPTSSSITWSTAGRPVCRCRTACSTVPRRRAARPLT